MTKEQHRQSHSRRDLFLAAALQGILASNYEAFTSCALKAGMTMPEVGDIFANAAANLADAMLRVNPSTEGEKS